MIKDVLLTPAELRVLLLLGEGLKNDEIGRRLGRTKNTIRTHIKRLYAKVGTSKRLQLVLYVMNFFEGSVKLTEHTRRNTREFEEIKLSLFQKINFSCAIGRKQGKYQVGHVYFILDGANDGIKIGWTTSLERRLKLLQRMTLNKLELVFSVAGTLVKERTFHKRFKESNIHGEWFRYSGEIKEYLKSR